MRVIKANAARFENTKIYVHRRSVKEGRRVDGRYIRIGGIFRLGAPNLSRLQFLGLHENLCLTITYPDYINDLLGVAGDLPELVAGGTTNWLCSVCCNVNKGALWYFIPKSIWGFVDGDYDKVIHTTSIVSTVAGEGGYYYNLLNLPLLSRKFLRSRYKTISLKGNS